MSGEPEIDGRADLFALGSLLWQCLTGRVAFERLDPMVVFAQLLTIDPRSRRRSRPACLRTSIDCSRSFSPRIAIDVRPMRSQCGRRSSCSGLPWSHRRTPRVVHREKLDAPRALVWAIFSDTDRWNRLAGAGLVTYTYDDPNASRVGHGELAGIPVAWRELGEWVEGRFGWGERRYDDGPLVANVLRFECTATDDGGTELFVETWPTADRAARCGRDVRATLRQTPHDATSRRCEPSSTRLLVDGAHAGLLDLRFELVCPTCRVAAQVVDDVISFGTRASCGECRRDFELDLDAHVDVIFSVH